MNTEDLKQSLEIAYGAMISGFPVYLVPHFKYLCDSGYIGIDSKLTIKALQLFHKNIIKVDFKGKTAVK